MTSEIVVTVVCVVAALLAALALIGRYPLKVVRRGLTCPENNYPARVGFVRKEKRWGNFVVSDVATCSLIPDGPVTCHKKCLTGVR